MSNAAAKMKDKSRPRLRGGIRRFIPPGKNYHGSVKYEKVPKTLLIGESEVKAMVKGQMRRWISNPNFDKLPFESWEWCKVCALAIQLRRELKEEKAKAEEIKNLDRLIIMQNNQCSH